MWDTNESRSLLRSLNQEIAPEVNRESHDAYRLHTWRPRTTTIECPFTPQQNSAAPPSPRLRIKTTRHARLARGIRRHYFCSAAASLPKAFTCVCPGLARIHFATQRVHKQTLPKRRQNSGPRWKKKIEKLETQEESPFQPREKNALLRLPPEWAFYVFFFNSSQTKQRQSEEMKRPLPRNSTWDNFSSLLLVQGSSARTHTASRAELANNAHTAAAGCRSVHTAAIRGSEKRRKIDGSRSSNRCRGRPRAISSRKCAERLRSPTPDSFPLAPRKTRTPRSSPSLLSPPLLKMTSTPRAASLTKRATMSIKCETSTTFRSRRTQDNTVRSKEEEEQSSGGGGAELFRLRA
ncbi:hypothetical protein MRX96_030548 [Rhipicephalus microplus]